MRCFFAAHGLLVTGKLPEAHALFGRAAQRASEASSLHEVRLAQQQAQQLPTGYKMLWQPPSCSGCQLDRRWTACPPLTGRSSHIEAYCCILCPVAGVLSCKPISQSSVCPLKPAMTRLACPAFVRGQGSLLCRSASMWTQLQQQSSRSCSSGRWRGRWWLMQTRQLQTRSPRKGLSRLWATCRSPRAQQASQALISSILCR